MNLREATRLVLSESLLPLSAGDAWAEIVRRGLDKQSGSKGKTPDRTVSAYLSTAAKEAGSGIVAEGAKPTRYRFVPGAANQKPRTTQKTKRPIPKTKTEPKTQSNTVVEPAPSSKPLEKTSGWVYILTNPSFREDWVKIGKSSRPVNVRSKELDNTAVPLPFEIFATLKTEKYAIVEQNIHNVIDELTKLRIRHNREFFNITPEKAFKLLEKEARLLDDAELVRYDKNEPVGRESRASGRESKITKRPGNKRDASMDCEWKTTRRGIVGLMRVSGGRYEVLPGSDICMGCEPRANEKVKKLRMSLLRNGHILQTSNGGWKLEKSVFFESPSRAAVFVLGGSQNGWAEWKNAEGKTLQSVRERRS